MKKILIAFFAFLLIVLVGGVVYIFTFDVNSYKSQIERVVSEKIGMTVKVNGPMTLAKSLKPTLIAENISILNPDGFEDKNFLTAKKASFSFDLAAFFRKMINIQNVEVSDVSISLEVNPLGKNNWTMLHRAQDGSAKKSARPTLSKSSDVILLAQTQVDLISMTNVKINFIDGEDSKQKEILLTNFSLTDLADFKGSAVFENETIAFSGSVKNLLSVLQTKRNLNFNLTLTALNGQANIFGTCRDILNCSRDIVLNITAEGKDLKKAYTSAVFGGVENDYLPAESYKLKVNTKLLNGQMVSDGSVDLDAIGVHFSYNIDHNLLGQLGSGRFNLDIVKPEFVQLFGLKPFTLQSAYTLEVGKKIEFTNFSTMFDETDIDGSISVMLDGVRPIISGEIRSHYFKPANVFSDEVGKKHFPSDILNLKRDLGKELFSKKTLNMAWMKKFDMNLAISIDNWYAKNAFVRYPTIKANVLLDAGSLKITLNEGTNLAEGNLVGLLSLDTVASIPQWKLDLVAEKLNFNQVNLWKKQLLAGTMDMNLFLTAQGDNLNSISNSLNGELLVVANQLEILSPIVSSLFSASAQGGSSYQTVQDLFVKCGVVNALVKNGTIVFDKNAVFETNRFNMLINGDVNLGGEQLNLRFIPQKNFTRASASGQPIKAVSLTGRLQNPEVGIDKDVSKAVTQILPMLAEKGQNKKTVLDLYKKKTSGEDVSLCRIAATGLTLKSIDAYFGRLEKKEVEQKPVVKPVKVKPTKAQKLGRELLDNFSDVLSVNEPVPAQNP
ncbi:MAG: AsmA family protein [Alphaproteobacteria bacterium]|nr:AsmA family protein [Alphaproteobacteria bacterium]